MFAYVSASLPNKPIDRPQVRRLIADWHGAHRRSAPRFSDEELSENYHRLVVVEDSTPVQELCVRTDATKCERVVHFCIPRPERDNLQVELPIYIVGSEESSLMMFADLLGKAFIPTRKLGDLIRYLKLADVKFLANSSEIEQATLLITNISVKTESENLLHFQDFFPRGQAPLSIEDFSRVYRNLLSRHRNQDFVKLGGRLGGRDIALLDTGIVITDGGDETQEERHNIEATVRFVRALVDLGLWRVNPV